MAPVATTQPAAAAASAPVSKGSSTPHPLDPPSAADIQGATSAVRAFLVEKGSPGETLKFCSVMLMEPAKAGVIEAIHWPGGAAAQSNGAPIERQVEVVAIDCRPGAPGGGEAWEFVVTLPPSAPQPTVARANKLPEGMQPSLTPEELCAAEQHVRKHPEVIKAAADVGLKPEEVYADGWSIGYDSRWPGRRLQQALLFARPHGQHSNLYAHPMDFSPLLDVNTGEVLAVDYTPHRIGSANGEVATTAENGHTGQPEQGSFAAPTKRERIAPPHTRHEYLPDMLDLGADGALRADLKPLHVVQPEGVSFSRKGNVLEWQKWKLHVGFHPREGLVLSTISYKDTDDLDGAGPQERPLFYRLSLAEMVVPYGHPDYPHYKKFALDIGEYGIGHLLCPLDLGCDCLGVIDYLDGVVVNQDGTPHTIKNAVCIHEEDAGTGWKHTDFRVGGRGATVRQRKLVISCVAVVSNYEYRIAYEFYLDGTIMVEIGLTGILNVTLLEKGEKPAYATAVAPQVGAQVHQHLFSVRVDPHIDGPRNSVVEQSVLSDPHKTGSNENFAGNAFDAHRRVLRTSGEAVRDADAVEERQWSFVNPNRTHPYSGKPVGYKVLTKDQPRLHGQPDSIVATRAPFARHHFWAVPYAEDRRYPAGKHCVQTMSTPKDSLPGWVAADEGASIDNEDLVAFITVGTTHIPRPEDYPVMPMEHVRFALKPSSFFRRNPMYDVPQVKDAKSVPANASAAANGASNGGAACCA